MDSRMLEVAIGLALVFALFGLLVTAIHEWLAQMLKSRGKTLRVAVTSLLGDNAGMADALMKHPLLVSMAEGNANSRLRPSYLSPDVFVSALIGHLTKEYLQGDDKPATPAEFVTRLKAVLPANLSESLTTLLPGVETDWPGFEQRLCAWYEAVGERASGWYKRKTQRDLLLIGTVTAALLNINPIVIGPRLWDDDVLRKSLVTAGEQASTAHEEALGKGTAGEAATAAGAAAALTSLKAQRPQAGSGEAGKVAATPQSGTVEQKFAELKQTLEGAAKPARERRSGEMSLRLQALDAVKRLLPALDEARLAGDGSLERQRQGVQARLNLESELATLRSLAASPAGRAVGEDLAARIDELRKAIDEELTDREKFRVPTPPGLCDKARSAEALAVCERMNDLNSLQVAGLPIGWSPLYLPNVVQDSTCKRVEWTQARLKAQIEKARERPDESQTEICAGSGLLSNPNVWLALFGWVLTGLAGSLGATFWFDLLTRFVKLRGSGSKPESPAAAASPAGGTSASGASSPPGGAGGVMARPAAAAPTPRTPASSDVLNIAEAALLPSEVEEIQRRLNIPVTGYFNQATRDAIARRQREQHQDESGELTAAQIIELLGRPPSGDGDGFVG